MRIDAAYGGSWNGYCFEVSGLQEVEGAMTKQEKIREAKLILALKVIRTWANHYHDNFWSHTEEEHVNNLKHIAKECEYALGYK